jgi:hypothetical protein
LADPTIFVKTGGEEESKEEKRPEGDQEILEMRR